MRFHCLLAALVLVLLTTACGSGSGSGGPGIGDGISGRGTLVAVGGNSIKSRNLADGSTWVNSTIAFKPASVLATAHPDGTELYVGYFNQADPFYIDIYDLSIFELKEAHALEWPDTADSQRLLDLAISPDGTHAAGILQGFRENYLEVIDLEGRRSILKGFSDDTGSDLAWQDHSTLVFSMDLEEVNAPGVEDYVGGIVAVDISDHIAGTRDPDNANVDIELLVGFEEWKGVNDVRSFVVSREEQLVYTYGGDLWMLNLRDPSEDPRQLTSGPGQHQGAMFSPDAKQIAFINYVSEFASTVHLIPTNAPGPILIGSASPNRLDSVAAHKILAWLPPR